MKIQADGFDFDFPDAVDVFKFDEVDKAKHTYLGDWIRQQESGVRDGIDGAQSRLAAAQDLKRRLELILEGDAPFDIFVR